MTRIVYVSPDSNSPTGGIKVIYKHVELLRRLGADAYVMHIKPGYRCDWFENSAPIISLGELQQTDLVMVPEIMTILATQLHGMGIRYCMFVQNGYLVLPTAPMPELQACYRNAQAVLSISDDTSSLLSAVFPEISDKVLRCKYSVDTERFKPLADKPRKVTYMPRKLPIHANNVAPWLAKEFPDWEFRAIHGMSEAQVAAELASSRVFLAFSDFEGCPVPPIEAALSGNVVLGYPGWGGREYWDEPNFRVADFGDIRDFVRKFYEVAAFASRPDLQAVLAPGMARLKADYGLQAEANTLVAAINAVIARIGGIAKVNPAS
ncbi:hypothetical protein [Roseateles sp. BYS96W]|uniref:Glycosyltransferase family 1 protein n=1 Tax=Pelomonas nitida TaxID=3299027 RepID=A0ABW7G5B7_9BURK